MSTGGTNGEVNSDFLHSLSKQLQIAADYQHKQGPSSQGSSHLHHDSIAMSENDFPLSIGIDRAALTSSHFDSDEFLSARRHLPLDELKSQLIAHMKELKTELVELINSDYADFINLSTNLNGVDRMMESLRKPLDRMKDDATGVGSNLQSVIGSLEQKLEQRAEIRERKASLQLLLNISESVSKVEALLQISGSDNSAGPDSHKENISVAKRLERVAIEYNQMQYLVGKGTGLPFVTNIEWRLTRIKETMGENLSNVLRTCVHSIQSGEAQSPSNKEALTQCLRTYALIDQTGEAEKIISEDLLAPFINKTITQPTLSEQTHTQRNGTNGVPQRHLVIMYNHIITFIEANCRALINVTQKELKGTNYDIPVNCIWDVTTQAILKHSKTILPLVNADGFHRNFMDTMDFVSKIEELCGSRRSLIRLRAHPNYQAIMKGWQLPAYFQLRFREISTVVEDALQLSVDNLPKIPGVDEHLPSSTAVIRAVERCWSSDVYVYGIAYSFWKLTLQILARYTVWVSANVARVTDSAKERPALSRSSSPAPGSSGSINSRQTGRSTPAPASLRPTGPVGRNTLEDQMLQQLTLIAGDIDHVAQKIQEAMEQQIRPKLPPSFTDEPVLQESFEQGIQAIQQELPGIQQRVAALLIRRCVDALVNVKTFTSRYGEGPPKEPSQFVTQILEPLSQYIVGPGATLKRAVRDEWAMEVIVATTSRYGVILAERLLEIKVSEEKTNKIKAAGAKSRGVAGGVAGLFSRTPNLPNAFSTTSSDAEANMSTDDKLRLQCVLDVICYKSELTKFNIEPDTFEPFQELQANTQPYEHLLSIISKK